MVAELWDLHLNRKRYGLCYDTLELRVPGKDKYRLEQLYRIAMGGLLIGIAVPLIGLVAAGGLTLFFVGAIITHPERRSYKRKKIRSSAFYG